MQLGEQSTDGCRIEHYAEQLFEYPVAAVALPDLHGIRPRLHGFGLNVPQGRENRLSMSQPEVRDALRSDDHLRRIIPGKAVVAIERLDDAQSEAAQVPDVGRNGAGQVLINIV